MQTKKTPENKLQSKYNEMDHEEEMEIEILILPEIDWGRCQAHGLCGHVMHA